MMMLLFIVYFIVILFFLFFFFCPLPFSVVYLSRLEYLHSDDEDHDRYDDLKYDYDVCQPMRFAYCFSFNTANVLKF